MHLPELHRSGGLKSSSPGCCCIGILRLVRVLIQWRVSHGNESMHIRAECRQNFRLPPEKAVIAKSCMIYFVRADAGHQRSVRIEPMHLTDRVQEARQCSSGLLTFFCIHANSEFTRFKAGHYSPHAAGQDSNLRRDVLPAELPAATHRCDVQCRVAHRI